MFLLDSAFCQEECRNTDVSRRKLLFAKPPALVKRHLLLFCPRPHSRCSCRSQAALWARDEPSSFSSLVVAASLQRLSPGTNFDSNLVGSSLRLDTHLLRILLYPTCSFCHMGGSPKPFVSIHNTICCLLTNISSPHLKSDLSFEKGCCDSFWVKMWSLSRFASWLICISWTPIYLACSSSSFDCSLKSFLSSVFHTPALSRAQRMLHGPTFRMMLQLLQWKHHHSVFWL